MVPTIHTIFSSFAFAAIVMLSASCSGDRGCNVFGAENYDPDAVIDDGSCIEVREKFLGQYSVSSDCIAGSYLRSVTQTADRFIVQITNLGDTLGTVYARVSASNITIDLQNVRNGVLVDGAGVYVEESGALSISYRITDNRSIIPVVHDCLDWCVKN